MLSTFIVKKRKTNLQILEEWADHQDLKNEGSWMSLLVRPVTWEFTYRYFGDACICGVTISQNGGRQKRRFNLDEEEITLDEDKAKNMLATKVIRAIWISIQESKSGSSYDPNSER